MKGNRQVNAFPSALHSSARPSLHACAHLQQDYDSRSLAEGPNATLHALDTGVAHIEEGSPVQAQDAGRLHVNANVVLEHCHSGVCMVRVHVLCNGACVLCYWV